MDGFLNIHKPAGMSSFKCLSIVRRKLGLKKVGFLGTLDPLASGVLVLLCGRATKLADKLHESTKVYQSEFTFGIETTTLDNEGAVTAQSDVIPTEKQIRTVLPSLVGEIEIEVPKFSAVHIDGNRAYDLARKGIDFTPPTRVVAVQRFEIIAKQSGSASRWFEIECQTGTYIRSLAKLMAQKLGTVAIASTIIRTRVGQFDIATAKDFDNVTIDDIIKV